MALLSRNASARRLPRDAREVVGAAARGDARVAPSASTATHARRGAADARGAHVEVTKRGRLDKTNTERTRVSCERKPPRSVARAMGD